MKLFRCEFKPLTVEIIELPRQSWRICEPRRLAVVATVAVIILTAVLWAVL